MIRSLQSLRGIFALFIFFHHYHWSAGQSMFAAGGDCGVSFFLILSGFVMSIGYSGKVLSHGFNYRKFMRHRIIRLYPIHLLCLAGYILLTYRLIDLDYFLQLLPNIFLLQSWSLNPEIYFSGNAVSWCLSDLMFFYAVFPLIIIFQKTCPRISPYVWTFMLMAYLILINFIPQRLQDALIYINPAFRILDFILGILLHHVFLRMKTARIGFIAFAEPFAILVLLLAIVIYPEIPSEYSLASYWWLPSSLIIIVFSQASEISQNKPAGFSLPLTRLLSSRPLVLFGNASFSFYMIHLLSIRFFSIIFEKLPFILNPYARLALVLSATIIASILIYEFFEKSIARIIRS